MCACKPNEKFFGLLGSSSQLESQSGCLHGNSRSLKNTVPCLDFKAILMKNLPSIALAQM